MQRKAPFRSCKRQAPPALLRAQIMLRQQGRCFDCGTRMILGKIVFDHRPPLALRAKGDNANDPDRLVAICTVCDRRKTPRDIKDIARGQAVGIQSARLRRSHARQGPWTAGAIEEPMAETGAQHRKTSRSTLSMPANLLARAVVGSPQISIIRNSAPEETDAYLLIYRRPSNL
jgi:hypothetical protein